jgi:hypothetical protein
MVPKDLHCIDGLVQSTSGRQTDGNGDLYDYIMIADHPLKKAFVPHPLQNYLDSDEAQTFYITRTNGLNIVTAIETTGGLSYASPLRFPINPQSIIALIGGAFLLFFFAMIGMTPDQRATGLNIGLVVFILSLVLAWAANVGPRINRKVNGNVLALKQDSTHVASTSRSTSAGPQYAATRP